MSYNVVALFTFSDIFLFSSTLNYKWGIPDIPISCSASGLKLTILNKTCTSIWILINVALVYSSFYWEFTSYLIGWNVLFSKCPVELFYLTRFLQKTNTCL